MEPRSRDGSEQPESAVQRGSPTDVSVLRFLTSEELAHMIKMAPRSIEKMRLESRGPRYIRLGSVGRVIYRLSDVEIWLSKHQKL